MGDIEKVELNLTYNMNFFEGTLNSLFVDDERLSKALLQITRRQITVLVLCYQYGFIEKEIGQILGIRQATVSKIKRLAIENMQLYINNSG